MHFEYLNLEAGYDFVEVYETNEAGKLLGLFTGNFVPPSLSATVDTVYIKFATDASGQRLGFKVHFDILSPMRQGLSFFFGFQP